MKNHIAKSTWITIKISKSILFTLLLILINLNFVEAQVISLPCQSDIDGFLGLDRKNWNGGSTAAHSEGSLHNFTLPPASPCKKISSVSIDITINNIDISNLPPGCAPPSSYYINITAGCPLFDPASCDLSNLVYEGPNNPLNTQNLTFNSPPEDFPFGENLGVDIVPVMDVNCTNGQSAISSGSIILDYDICVTVTLIDEVIDTPADLGPDQTICPSETTTLDPGVYTSYVWDPNGEITPTINVGPGTYVVTVTDINGCTDTDEVIVTPFTSSPITFNPTNPNVCDNGQVSVSVNEVYGSYMWSNSSTGQTVSLSPGIYDVTITDGNNCTAVNSVTVNNVPPPNAGVDNVLDVCDDGSTYNLDVLLDVHDAGGTWTDDNSSGVDLSNPLAVSFLGVAVGTYNFTYTVAGNAPCPPDQATIMIDVLEQNNAGTSNLEDLCSDPGNLDFYALIGNPDIGGTWSDIDLSGVDLNDPFDVNFDGVPPGTYNFEYLVNLNSVCPDQTATLTIIITESPLAGFDNSTTVCEGTQLNLLDLIVGANGTGVFSDTDGSGALIGSIVNTFGLAGQSFDFTYTVGSPTGPCGEDEAVFTVNIETSLSAGDGIFESLCTGEDIDLFDYLTNEDFGGFFTDENFSGGLNGNILNTSGIIPGSYLYTYEVGDGITCPIDQSEIVLTFFENPSYSFNQDEVTLCENICSEFQIDFTGSPPFNFPLEIYSAASGDLVISTNISINSNSYTFTSCNAIDSLIFTNDTLSLLTDSAWMVTIPIIDDLNCSVNSPNNPDTLFINTTSPSVFQLDTVACISDTVIINGVMLFDGNSTFVDTIAGVNCDSIININVNFTENDTVFINPTICPGDSIFIEFEWFNETLPEGIVNINNPSGCDSVIIINISFYPEAINTIDRSLCTGDSIIVNNTIYNASNPTGTEILVGQSSNGCDSTINISLQFIDDIVTIINDTLCPNGFIEVDGEIFDESKPSGQIILTGSSGCDTIIDIDLSFHGTADSLVTGTFCSDFSVQVNGIVYDISNPSGSETLVGSSQFGCDSIVNIDLAFFSPIVVPFTPMICDNESIDVNGTTYDANNISGTEVFIGGSVNGCDSTVNVQVTVLQTYNISESVSICDGDSIFLGGDWQFTGGTYIDNFQTVGLCDSIISTTLTIDNCAIIVDLSSMNNNCANESNGSIAINIQSVIQNPFTITWSGTNTGQTGSQIIATNQSLININDLPSDIYNVSIIDSNGDVIYQGNIEIMDNNLAIGGVWMITDSILCAEELGSFEFMATGGQMPYNFAWTPSTLGNSSSAQDVSAGDYVLTITDVNGCTFDTVFTFTQPEILSATLVSTSLTCLESIDGQIEISEISGGVSPYNINVNNQPTNNLLFSNLDTGLYVIEVIDDNDCKITFNEELTAESNVLFGTYTESYQIEEGESVDIEGTVINGDFTFVWVDADGSLSCTDCPNPIANPSTSTTYTLVITDEFGCTQSLTIMVEVVEKEIEKAFPNIFSPNGDGVNDDFIFRINDARVSGLEMSIYDRWGNQIFRNESADNIITWNGRNNGDVMNNGVFVYKTIVNYQDGTSEVIIGDVLLIN